MSTRRSRIIRESIFSEGSNRESAREASRFCGRRAVSKPARRYERFDELKFTEICLPTHSCMITLGNNTREETV